MACEWVRAPGGAWCMQSWSKLVGASHLLWRIAPRQRNTHLSNWCTVDQHLIYVVKAQGHRNREPGGRSWDPKGIEGMPAPRYSFYSFFLGRKDQSLSLYMHILADVTFVSLASPRRFIMMRLLLWKCQHLCSVLAKVLKIKFLRGMQDLDTPLSPLDIHKAKSDIFLHISWHYAFPDQEPEAYRTTWPRPLTI